MTFYCETSFLAPLVRRETASDRAAKFLRGLPQRELGTSHWTRVEFSSAIARDVRMKIVDSQEAMTAIDDFDNKILASFSLFAITADDCELARSFLCKFETGLRAGDALHLAIAKNNNARAIYSLDNKMIRAGQILGLPVSTGIRLMGRR